jgi:hypothetical protein
VALVVVAAQVIAGSLIQMYTELFYSIKEVQEKVHQLQH